MQKIKDKISQAELTLLKSLNFEIYVHLPKDYIIVYSAILYPDNEEDILEFALRISCDSFFTYINLIYKNYVVAVACVIVAAMFLSLPTIMDKNFKGLENMKVFADPPATEEEFNRRLLCFENRSLCKELRTNSETYFDILEWNKKVHPYLEIEDLLDCLNMIYEFYDDLKKYSMKGITAI